MESVETFFEIMDYYGVTWGNVCELHPPPDKINVVVDGTEYVAVLDMLVLSEGFISTTVIKETENSACQNWESKNLVLTVDLTELSRKNTGGADVTNRSSVGDILIIGDGGYNNVKLGYAENIEIVN